MTTEQKLVKIDPLSKSLSPIVDHLIVDFSIGYDYKVWVLENRLSLGGFQIGWYDYAKFEYFKIPPPASAIKLKASLDGFGWIVNEYGNIWKIHPYGGGNFNYCQVHTSCDRCLYHKENEVMDIDIDNQNILWFSKKETINLNRSVFYFSAAEDNKTNQFISLSEFYLKKFVQSE